VCYLAYSDMHRDAFTRLRHTVATLVLILATAACANDAVAPTAVPLGVTRVWRMPMPGVTTLMSFSRGTVTDSGFSFVTPDGVLLGVSRSDGTTRWTTRGPRSSPKALLFAGGAVIYPGVSVAAFNASDGSARWTLPVASEVSGCDAAATPTITIVCSPDWNVTAIDVATGAARWSVSLRDSLNGLPTLVGTTISGDTVYAAVKQLYSTTIGFAQALIFALSLNDGRLLSLTREGDYTDFTGYVGTPRVVGRTLIIPHLINNKLTGIDRFSGKVIWRITGDPGWAGFVSIPTVVDGVFYSASADRRVYAVEAATGAIRWKSEILEGSQELAAACGNVVVTWTGVNVRVLDRATGRYLGAIIDDIPPGLDYAITSPPLTEGNELFVRSQKEYRKYTCR
jgi:outer membrane protein assembly factor BamB